MKITEIVKKYWPIVLLLLLIFLLAYLAGL